MIQILELFGGIGSPRCALRNIGIPVKAMTIAACKADMKNDGVKVIKETDGLIIRAITLYCKAEFGFNNAAEQFRKSYDALKMRLSLSAEYNTAPQVSETDTNSTESGV